METKFCADCKQHKPLSDFSWSRKNKGYSKRYPHTYCKPCSAKRSQHYYQTPHGQRLWRKLAIKSKFGMTQADYDALFASQGGVCAICGCSETRIVPRTGLVRTLTVDHDHSKGSRKSAVRGLLCSNCNRALGLFKDDPKLLLAAAAYLQRFLAGVGSSV